MTPFVSDSDLTLYVGDCLDVLRSLPDRSVDCCVTSPPYWGLRDYGTDGQLGLEASPDAYVAALVAVFGEIRRVLADHGTLWLNLGDSYASKPAGANGYDDGRANREERTSGGVPAGFKPKDLVGIPWRVAFALQTDGWYLRSDIIWAKPNPMPESVTDRPTKAHEYVFLLSKGPRYFFDQEAVREPAVYPGEQLGVVRGTKRRASANGRGAEASGNESLARSYALDAVVPEGGRNVRSVWQIATQPYADAHFATFPEELPRRCILAGCPEWVCGTCGKARERILKRQPLVLKEPAVPIRERRGDAANDKRTALSGTQLIPASAETVGWSDCGHNDYRPGTVLDPFFGSGTTGLVARKHGRRTIGIELNPDYARMAARRLQQLSLLA